MARSRIIRPEFFTHLDLYRAEQESGLPLRLAYAGLWCAADREGRFKWEPEVLKLTALPFDVVDFGAVLEALEKAGLILGYSEAGKRYGFIPSFHRHQPIHHREAPSRCPAPPSAPAPEKPGLIPEKAGLGPGKGRVEPSASTSTSTSVSTSTSTSPSAETVDEKRHRLKAGLRLLGTGTATAGIPNGEHPEAIA